jgi:hypothetical protein
VKKIILAALGALAVTVAMAMPVSAGAAAAAVIPHTAALHSAPSVSKQTGTCSELDGASATVSVGPPGASASGTWNKKESKLEFALSGTELRPEPGFRGSRDMPGGPAYGEVSYR